MTEAQAQAFIRHQLGVYQLLGITTMTPKQRARIERGEVIAEDRKQEANAFLDAISRYYGPPPHQRTGRVRRANLISGEVQPSASAFALGQKHTPALTGLEKPHG